MKRHIQNRYLRRPRAGAFLAFGLGGLLWGGCTEPLQVREPDDGMLAAALIEGAELLTGEACHDELGSFWPAELTLAESPCVSQLPRVPVAVRTGWERGQAGMLQGLLSTLIELRRTEEDPSALERLEAVLTSGAVWLASRGQVSDPGDGVRWSWPQCVDVAAASGAEGMVCPEAERGVAVGLRSGLAGVGQFFLGLAQDEQSRGVAAGETHLAMAEGVGLALLDQARGGESGQCWADSSGTEVSLSLGSGVAGVGFYLLQLSQAVTDGSRYLTGAEGAGRYLVSLLPETCEAALLPSTLPVDGTGCPSQAEEQGVHAGLLEGNAGLAYFLLALHAGTEDADGRYLCGAKSLLSGLLTTGVSRENLTGRAWSAVQGASAETLVSGFAEGTAGVGWVFLQAARGLSAEDVGTASSYLEVALSAAAWLAHPEVAYYPPGLVWWPQVVAGSLPGVASEALTEDVLSPGWWWSSLPQADEGERLGTGLDAGGAGVGLFFADLYQGLAWLSAESKVRTADADCWAELALEGRNASARYLYYRGEDAGWAWGAVADWREGTELWSVGLPWLSGGAMGVLGFLAWDRLSDDVGSAALLGEDGEPGPYTYPGLRPLEPQ